MFRELIDVPAVGPSVFQFADRLLEYQEPFIATAQSLPPLSLTDSHLRHAELVLAECPAFASFRFRSCPRRVSDERFWSAYFTLLASEERFRATVRSGDAVPDTRQFTFAEKSPSPRPPAPASCVSKAGSKTDGRDSLPLGETVTDKLKDSGLTLLNALTTSIASFVEELDRPESESGDDANQGDVVKKERRLHDATCCRLPPTFYVAEAQRPLSSSTPARSSFRSMSSPVTPSPASSDVSMKASKQVTLLRLAPWWCHLESRQASESAASLDALEERDDKFEWYY